MTLWVAMTEGDVYAVCPLLPGKWQPTATQLPSLTTATAAKKDHIGGGKASPEAIATGEAQYEWLKELDGEEPVLVPAKDELNGEIAIYPRPAHKGSDKFSAVPRLQGPFRLLPGDLEDDLELAAIHVVAPKIDAEELLDGDEPFDLVENNGPSWGLVSLITRNGRVYVCLNLDPVEGSWLPLKKVTIPRLYNSTLLTYALESQASAR